jgi:hypothetical protein
MPLESSIVGIAGASIVSEIDSRWTMAYAAALGDSIPCYMDTVGGVIAHPMFPVGCTRRMTPSCIARFGHTSA